IQDTISSRTQKMTRQLIEVFIIQLNGAMLFMIIPLCGLFTDLSFDLHDSLPDEALQTLRMTMTILLMLDPLQFPLIYIVETGGH
ncbi:hypothetical protein PFISCL1PPCAC_13995, partial [Pristionchus fissidentatus]